MGVELQPKCGTFVSHGARSLASFASWKKTLVNAPEKD